DEVIAPALLPASLGTADLDAANAILRRHARDQGLAAFQAAITRGQYHRDDGLYFGGRGPTWSRRRMAGIAAHHLAGPGPVAVVDCHTGLGGHGFGEVISIAAPDSAEFARALNLFGPGVTSTLAGDSVSAHLIGSLDEGMAGLVGPADLTFVALEVGTRDGQTVIAALRDDNWLHARGHPGGAEAAAIKARLKDAFAPAETGWQDRVYGLGIACVTRALQQL
ncbi:MAG: DUF2817 domain-containing protein, partial [Zavarzinia sp.]|nr:DUF2817 domain-containing protein [Zavarzinia sp.]